MKTSMIRILAILFLVACAGTQRSCARSCATNFGADYIVAQFRMDGTVMNCWKLTNVSVSNEENSDGIYWTESGHLVHIAGIYNYVQVDGGKWQEAAKKMNINLAGCDDGAYSPSAGASE